MNNWLKVEIGFGIGEDKHRNKLSALFVLESITKIEQLAGDIFGGFTWIHTEGGWKNEKGEMVLEEGRTLLLQIPPSRRHEAEQFSKFVRDTLRQNCVTLAITPVEFELV